jgi:hypothetical protein
VRIYERRETFSTRLSGVLESKTPSTAISSCLSVVVRRVLFLGHQSVDLGFKIKRILRSRWNPSPCSVTRRKTIQWVQWVLNGEREATELIAGDGRDIDLEIKIHPEIFRLLQNGEWEAAHWACLDLGPLLLADGFKPDGIRIVAGKWWRERFVAEAAGK